METDYKQQREALLARLARAEQSYKENLDRAVKMKAKADALEVSSHFGPYSQVFIKAIALLRN